jgi:hypothetical protein
MRAVTTPTGVVLGEVTAVAGVEEGCDALHAASKSAITTVGATRLMIV